MKQTTKMFVVAYMYIIYIDKQLNVDIKIVVNQYCIRMKPGAGHQYDLIIIISTLVNAVSTVASCVTDGCRDGVFTTLL